MPEQLCALSETNKAARNIELEEGQVARMSEEICALKCETAIN